MNNLNSLMLEGNLAKDPNFTETGNGTLCNLTLAVNRTYKDSKGEKVEDVSFFDVETWGNLAEFLKKENVKKGRGVRVVGRLKQGRWKDVEGKSHSKIFVVAEHVELKQQIRKAPSKDDNGINMNNLNSLMLEGNLVRDPEHNETQMGTSVSNFSLAVNRTYKDSKGEKVDDVSFFDVETWGNLAEFLKKENVKKGRGVRVVGRLKQGRWKDVEGKSHSKIFVVAEHIELKQQIRKAPSKDTDYERGM